MSLKQITVAGRVYRMQAEEIVIERLVREAHAAKQRLLTATVEFNALRDELVELASGRRGPSNTVSLGRIDLVAKVRFTQSVSFDADALNPARELLGDEAFSRLFAERRGYTARKPLDLFLKVPGNVVVKNLIQKAMTVRDSAPKVEFDQIEE